MMIKDYLPKSLFGRTFLIVMVPVLLLQVAVSIVFLDRHWSKMTDRLASAVVGEMIAAVEVIENNPDRFDQTKDIFQNHMEMAVHLDKTAFNIDAVVKGRDIPRQNPFDTIEDDLNRIIAANTDKPFHVSVQPDEKRVTVIFLTSQGVVTFLIPEGRLFSSSSYIFILWMMGLSLLLFTIAMIFMRNQIRPIYRLGIVAERMGRGIPVEKIKVSGAREVRQTTEAFIQMQNRINQFITQRTTMLAGVSHDLRTPLTRMKLQLEMMPDGPDKEAMQDDIHDMETMIEGYLSFVRGDGGEDVSKINMAAFMDKICDDARRIGLKVTESLDNLDDVILWGKPLALARAFDNFISNAARHAQTVHISAMQDGEHMRVVIADDGEGVPDSLLQDILKPFVRGESSRNSKTGGVGLGLTIANDIITSHGGVLTLDRSDVLGGLEITVTLPL